jgi:hypothetical protein
MFKLFAIVILFTIGFAFRVTEKDSKPYLLIESTNVLRFDNFSGPGIHPKQITQFTIFAKEASSLFQTNVSAHANYIKENMDNEFGNAQENFFVMIQTGRTNSSYYVWITDKKVYASLSGINPSQPDWSYLFVKINAPRTVSGYVFIEHGQIGMGITPAIDDYISRTIDRFEPYKAGPCECRQEAILSIGNALNMGLNQAWSSICGRPEVSHSLAYTVNGLWINKQRNNCEYTFYVHQL